MTQDIGNVTISELDTGSLTEKETLALKVQIDNYIIRIHNAPSPPHGCQNKKRWKVKAEEAQGSGRRVSRWFRWDRSRHGMTCCRQTCRSSLSGFARSAQLPASPVSSVCSSVTRASSSVFHAEVINYAYHLTTSSALPSYAHSRPLITHCELFDHRIGGQLEFAKCGSGFIDNAVTLSSLGKL